MYAAIYRFHIDDRAEDALRKGNQELLPEIRKIPGFIAHYAIHISDQEALQIAIFEDETQAQQFEQVAMGWVQRNLGPDFGPPYNRPPREVIHGHVKSRTTPNDQRLDLRGGGLNQRAVGGP